jgi:MATE family multidrug resistance protein
MLLTIGSGAHREVLRLAGPMIVSNVSIALLGMVDTAVVGHLDNPGYLAGVALAAVLFDFLYWGLTFLRMGTTGTIAQMHGAGDWAQVRSALVQALLVGAILGVGILSFKGLILDSGLALLDGSETAQCQARRYYEIKIWGAPAVLGLMVITGWLIGMQNARAALTLAVITNLVNVALDLLFVIGFHMEVRGVAWASLLAAYVGLLTGLILVGAVLKRHPAGSTRTRRLTLSGFRRMLALNYNIMLRTVCLIAAFAYFTKQGARQGDVILASNALLLNFQMLMALGLDGFANATEALIGRAIGGADRRAFGETIRVAATWSAAIACAYSVVYFVFGPGIIDLLTSIEVLRETARVYLPWVVVSPLISVWCFLLDGVFIGATRGREMRNAMIVSVFLVFVPACSLFTKFGNHGLWLAFMLFFVARGVSMTWLFLRIDRGMGFVGAR